MAQPWMIALVVVVTLLGLLAVLVAIKCVCSRGRGVQGKGLRGGKMLGRHATALEGYKTGQVELEPFLPASISLSRSFL